jgi:hypothetical protein
MRALRILRNFALIGLGVGLGIGLSLSGNSASAHHTHGATRHHAHRIVYPAYPRQAYYWQNGVRPPLQSLGSYCPPPRLIPHNRAADNAHDVDVGEYCD